ncbi:MAG TPA: NosD domain-containing protein [Candidatus Acidoferrales bacterium]|nr:NosD domain-containing protein [Candidatus Acidoferrales bacterium]
MTNNLAVLGKLDKNLTALSISETERVALMTRPNTIVLSSIVTLAILSLILTIAPPIHCEAAESSIQIDVNGAITSPSSDVPIQREGDTYYLTGNSGPIFVYRNNIVLDGRGYAIEGADPIGQGPNDFGGIHLDQVDNVTIKNFSIKNTWFGISLDYCTNVFIINNTISGIWHPLPLDRLPAGVLIRGGYNNNLTDNRFEDNNVGICLWDGSKDNLFVGNSILRSVKEGVRLLESSGNTFYHNNFENSKNVNDAGWDSGRSARSVNIWTNGKEGNYWSDYTGTDSNGDGIGDTDHLINLQNADDFPLTEPFNQTNYLLKTTPPEISLLSPINQVYNQTEVPLTFVADKALNWIGYSLNNEVNITLSSNQILIQIPQGTHNITVYAFDEFGNVGASETVTFIVNAKPESPIFPLTGVAIAVTAIAVICAIIVLCLKKRRR